ncbi:MAG: 4Fe-4S binding protein [Bacteroidetes bacterium]|nr:4Fe-4S binding protein [Bacteroidota bacterium]
MKKKSTSSNWLRRLFQWGVILVIIILAILPKFNKNFTPDFEAYCPFGGLQALGSYILNNSLACTMTSAQIVMGVMLIIGLILFGKLFCSYICPLGTIGEWLGKLGDKLKVRITVKGIADKILRSLKYILLFIVLQNTLSSSELFCKKFDPYFAIVSNFDTDVVVLYAIISIVVLFLSSIFIRMFWCKYICPLGAISNIFKFSIFAIATLVIYILLLTFGLEISFVWPLAVACIGGYVIEIFKLNGKYFPIARITRNEKTCANCQLCSMNCPQGIDVAKMTTVKDVDCNLCGDCLSVCPVKETLQINKKKNLKWLPAIAISVLIVIGLYLGSTFEIPTIDKQWGDEEAMAKAETYSRSGLKNIKCFGSSSAFASQMRKIDGILGVATYVKTHTAKIYYDPSVINIDKISKALFTAQKVQFRSLGKEVTQVKEVNFLVENFFDVYDFRYMSILLRQKTKAVGLQTEYGCPVMAKIYFPADYKVNDEELKNIIESEYLKYGVAPKVTQVDLNYEVIGKFSSKMMSKKEFVNRMFNSYQSQFNNSSKYDSTKIATYRILLGKNSSLVRKFPYLSSHISNNTGILGMKTLLNENYRQVLDIKFVKGMIDGDSIYDMINNKILDITFSNGKKVQVDNLFHFDKKGIVLEN